VLAITGIRQDEPTDTRGMRNFTPDGRGVGTPMAEVRAESWGGGDGRVYHIGFQAQDDQGLSCTGTVQVGVPHDQHHNIIDGGALYDSTN